TLFRRFRPPPAAPAYTQQMKIGILGAGEVGKTPPELARFGELLTRGSRRGPTRRNKAAQFRRAATRQATRRGPDRAGVPGPQICRASSGSRGADPRGPAPVNVLSMPGSAAEVAVMRHAFKVLA